MPDIAMCKNETCPLKKSCYRFLAIPFEPAQCYAEFEYKDGKCESYWRVRVGHKVNKVLFKELNIKTNKYENKNWNF